MDTNHHLDKNLPQESNSDSREIPVLEIDKEAEIFDNFMQVLAPIVKKQIEDDETTI
jgi:hypothetical protein